MIINVTHCSIYRAIQIGPCSCIFNRVINISNRSLHIHKDVAKPRTHFTNEINEINVMLYGQTIYNIVADRVVVDFVCSSAYLPALKCCEVSG